MFAVVVFRGGVSQSAFFPGAWFRKRKRKRFGAIALLSLNEFPAPKARDITDPHRDFAGGRLNSIGRTKAEIDDRLARAFSLERKSATFAANDGSSHLAVAPVACDLALENCLANGQVAKWFLRSFNPRANTF